MDYREAKKLAEESRDIAEKLLSKPKLSKIEEAELLTAAYGSLYLWTRAGTSLQTARGQWFVTRVLCFLGEARLAQQHAQLCDFFTKKSGDRKDFDEAYAMEALARVSALKGDKEAALRLKLEAGKLGGLIRDQEDRKTFETQLSSLSWFGI